MTDMGRTIQDDKGASRPDDEGGRPERNPRTEGSDRDFDESQESKNQGHGHPREERSGSGESGHSERKVTEADREQRDLGGPGG